MVRPPLRTLNSQSQVPGEAGLSHVCQPSSLCKLTSYKAEGSPGSPGSPQSRCHGGPLHGCPLSESQEGALSTAGIFKNPFFFFWSCLTTCRILVPQPGIEPVPPAFRHRVFTTGPPGKSLGLVYLEPKVLSAVPVLPSTGRGWGNSGVPLCTSHPPWHWH